MKYIIAEELSQYKTIKPSSVLCADCMDVLPLIPDKSVNLILCDPPYGMTAAKWDENLNWDLIWKQLKRVLVPNGVACLLAINPFASDLIQSNKEWFRYDLIWVKNKVTGHLNANRMPLRNHESVLVFYEKLPDYNPQMTQGHEPLHYAVNRGKTELYGEFDSVESRTGARDRYPKSVLQFDVVNNSERIHPTQKPVDLFSYLIKSYSKEGDCVLDFTAGALTTALAAHLTHRKYICIEQESMYIEAGLEKLQSISSHIL
jgi:DNA modification methylase